MPAPTDDTERRRGPSALIAVGDALVPARAALAAARQRKPPPLDGEFHAAVERARNAYDGELESDIAVTVALAALERLDQLLVRNPRPLSAAVNGEATAAFACAVDALGDAHRAVARDVMP